MLLKKENIGRVLETLAAHGKLLVPSAVDGVTKFVPYAQGMVCDFESINSLLPPKDALFPQTERMYSFQTGEQTVVSEHIDADQQIIFGVRPCDAASIARMDAVFLTKGFVDDFYKRKRENLVIIAVSCVKSSSTCFCDSMGIDPGTAKEADILLNPSDKGFILTAQTEKGKNLANTISSLLEKESGKPLPKAICSLKVNMNGVSDSLSKMFDDNIWDTLYRQCIGCGTCTYICPTCYCFEIGSAVQGKQGTQFRCWDSCMFSEYSRMAGGHNPRPSKKERIRNRYLHKLAFYEERYGMGLCVGCGRCIEKCPAGMDITRVIDAVGKGKPHEKK